MPYQMYIADADGQVLFPVTPEKLTLKINNQNKTATLIDGGEVNLIKTPGLTDIKIEELLLPMVQHPFAVYESGFQSAEYYLDMIEAWKNASDPVSFILTRVSPGGQLLFDTNMSVTIESYEITEDADKQGMDVVVKLDMKQYRTWGAKKLAIKKKATDYTSAKVKKTTTTAPAAKKKTAKSYTVKKGDCLYNIAKAQLGKASRWTEIYSLNKSVIESTAKKYGRKSSSNGHWIYPGTVLTLPS